MTIAAPAANAAPTPIVVTVPANGQVVQVALQGQTEVTIINLNTAVGVTLSRSDPFVDGQTWPLPAGATIPQRNVNTLFAACENAPNPTSSVQLLVVPGIVPVDILGTTPKPYVQLDQFLGPAIVVNPNETIIQKPIQSTSTFAILLIRADLVNIASINFSVTASQSNSTDTPPNNPEYPAFAVAQPFFNLTVDTFAAFIIPLVPNRFDTLTVTIDGIMVGSFWLYETNADLTEVIANSSTPSLVNVKEPPQFEAYQTSGNSGIFFTLYTIPGSFNPSVTYPAGYGPADYKTAIIEVDWEPTGGNTILWTSYVLDGLGNAQFFYSQFMVQDGGSVTVVIPLPYAPIGGTPGIFIDFQLGGKNWDMSIVFSPERNIPFNNNNTWQLFDGTTPFPGVLLPPWTAMTPYSTIAHTNTEMPPFVSAVGALYITTDTIQPIQVDASGNLLTILNNEAAQGQPPPLAGGFMAMATDGSHAQYLNVDGSGNLKVAGTFSGTLTPNATQGSPPPTTGFMAMATDGTDAQYLRVNGSGYLEVFVENTVTVTGTVTATVTPNATHGSAVPTTGYMAMASDGTNAQYLLVDGSGNLKVAVENTVTVTGSVTVSGTVTATVTPNATQGSAPPTTGYMAMATDGSHAQYLTVNGSGYLEVFVENTVTVNGTVTANVIPNATHGSAVPTTGYMAMASDGTNAQYLLVDGSGNLKVAVENTVTVTGTVTATITPNATKGSAVPTTGYMAMTSDGTNAQYILVDGSGNVKVAIENTPTVTIGSQPIEIKGGSTTSVSVYRIGGGSVATVTLTNTNITQILAAPSAGTQYRLTNITVVQVPITTAGVVSMAWYVGNSTLSFSVGSGNSVPMTVDLEGIAYAGNSLNVQASNATHNVLVTIVYDVISSATIT